MESPSSVTRVVGDTQPILNQPTLNQRGGHTVQVPRSRLCAAAVSLLLARIGRWSGREIARSVLSLARSAQAERDNESCFFVHAVDVNRPTTT
ncbi:hypothetical protein EVAR_36415_1 [Eumeta japonica]|uniref:Uncharacterized protein n=1 Tax=Eumeta variegata TaxID=151549 RepID=A0A4C1VR73_EUMVA|nr:hypothetical protein EVAR_36415_1 [Eumeta japonica]